MLGVCDRSQPCRARLIPPSLFAIEFVIVTKMNHPQNDDRLALEKLGYQQELLRRMGGFSNYAVSLSIICILAGGITSFHLAFCATGGAGVVLGWLFMSLITLGFASTMGQLASAFPTAGGLYHWATILGGRGWGWITAWFNLMGLMTILAAINVGTFEFCWGTIGTLTEIRLPIEHLSYWQLGAVFVITSTQAALNHRSIHAVTLLTDLSGYLILLFSLALTISLLVYAPGYEWQRLITLTNYSGFPSESEAVWPRSESLLWMFGLGLLLPAYTITGYDASAHTSEETVDPGRVVPRSILQAVLVSSLFGWFMLIAIVLAIPNMDDAAHEGRNVVYWTISKVLPKPTAIVICIGIFIAQYICGLAAMTSTSRMMYAFARDGGLPASDWLKWVCKTSRTPVLAIWTVAVFSFLFTIFAPVYSTMTTTSVIFLYISYLLPTYLGLRTYGKSWTAMGPWTLGWAYRPLSVLCVVGGGAVIVIGVQPPNGIAFWITLFTSLLLAAIWLLYSRRTFIGPPKLNRNILESL